jgi:hypothetical protein
LAFLQSMVVGEVTKLYDRSVWTIRHYIRALEKVSLPVLDVSSSCRDLIATGVSLGTHCCQSERLRLCSTARSSPAYHPHLRNPCGRLRHGHGAHRRGHTEVGRFLPVCFQGQLPSH